MKIFNIMLIAALIASNTAYAKTSWNNSGKNIKAISVNISSDDNNTDDVKTRLNNDITAHDRAQQIQNWLRDQESNQHDEQNSNNNQWQYDHTFKQESEQKNYSNLDHNKQTTDEMQKESSTENYEYSK